MNTPKVLLFDLGGVIVPWVGIDVLAAKTGLDRDTVSQRLGTDPVFRAYERGACSDAEFLDRLSDAFDLPREGLGALWNSWVHPPYSGTLEALAALKASYTLACLSNTNALHWAHLNRMFDPGAVFHHAFASHEIGEAKPDAACYAHVVSQLGVSPGRIVFFDDTAANISAARSAGLTAYETDPAQGVLPVLNTLQIYPRRA